MAKERDHEGGIGDGDLGDRADAGRGERVEDLTGGLPPEAVPALRSVRDLSAVYPLLHALVGSSPVDYLVRAAALESLVGFETGTFSSGDLDECLYWLDPERRPAVLRTLRRSGWLAWEEPPEAPRRAEAMEIVPEVAALLSEPAGIEEAGRTVPLAEVVPRGDEGESFLRASLLPLVGRHTGGGGVAGRLGALALTVDGEGDGRPEAIGGGPLRRLTLGRIGPEEKE